MRDADEEEETGVRSDLGSTAGTARAVTPCAHQIGLPPPLIDTGDEETTRLMGNSGLGPTDSWLVSDGKDEPKAFSQSELLLALKQRRITPRAYAWKRGMNQWLKITQIDELNAQWLQATMSSAPPGPPRPGGSPTPASSKSNGGFGPTSASKSGGPGSTQEHLPSILLSSTVSTADFSEVASDSNQPAPAGVAAKASTTTPAADEGELEDADSAPNNNPVLEKRRPAAGRPPSPSEPIAIARPHQHESQSSTEAVLATGLAQARIDPKIAHSEVTLLARNRLPASQLPGHKPNILLWVLGAGGWAVAGILGGILIAQGDSSESVTTESSAAQVTPSFPVQEESPKRVARSGTEPDPEPAPPIMESAPEPAEQLDATEPVPAIKPVNTLAPQPPTVAPKFAARKVPSSVQPNLAANNPPAVGNQPRASHQPSPSGKEQPTAMPSPAQDVLTSPGF